MDVYLKFSTNLYQYFNLFQSLEPWRKGAMISNSARFKLAFAKRDKQTMIVLRKVKTNWVKTNFALREKKSANRFKIHCLHFSP